MVVQGKTEEDKTCKGDKKIEEEDENGKKRDKKEVKNE